MKLIIDVDEKLVCEGFERTFTEEERDILIRAIGNGVKYVEPKKGEWKVIGVKNSFWHVVCPKCNWDMLTEFNGYCPNCGEPNKGIDIVKLDIRGDKE